MTVGCVPKDKPVENTQDTPRHHPAQLRGVATRRPEETRHPANQAEATQVLDVASRT
jgi:hypothetical protein